MKKDIILEQEDIDSLHDTILEAINYSADRYEILEYWNKIPEHIKEEAIRWGIDDTVVRDNIYVWLKENK